MFIVILTVHVKYVSLMSKFDAFYESVFTVHCNFIAFFDVLLNFCLCNVVLNVEYENVCVFVLILALVVIFLCLSECCIVKVIVK